MKLEDENSFEKKEQMVAEAALRIQTLHDDSTLVDRTLKNRVLVVPWEDFSVNGEPPPGAILMRNVDTIFILSYSIIMLNTDLHNPQVKHKMKPEVNHTLVA